MTKLKEIKKGKKKTREQENKKVLFPRGKKIREQKKIRS